MKTELFKFLRLTPPQLPTEEMPASDFAEYPDLAQYPEAIGYLQSLGISPAELTAIYPEFEDYAQSDFDPHGHAFRYSHHANNTSRLDRVLFPSATSYPYRLAVDRQDRYIAPSPYAFGIRVLPQRRVRLDVYPDQSVSLLLQRATEADLIDMASYFIDTEGTVTPSELAMMNSQYLNTGRRYEERHLPLPIGAVSDVAEAHKIMYFAAEFLEQGWDLTEQDIGIPSAELAKKILMAPVEKGVNLKEMLQS